MYLLPVINILDQSMAFMHIPTLNELHFDRVDQQACSVWPIGDTLSWTWLEHTFDFWDGGWEKEGGSLLNGNREAFFWRPEGALIELRSKSRQCKDSNMRTYQQATSSVYG